MVTQGRRGNVSGIDYESALFGVQLGLFQSYVWQNILDIAGVAIVPIDPYYAALKPLGWKIHLDCQRLYRSANLDQSRGIWGANGFRGML